MFIKPSLTALSPVLSILILLAACTDSTAPESDRPAVDSPRQPLDLSLHPESAADPALQGDFSEHKKLPDFFEKDKKEKKQQKVSVSGKPLRDATNPDYVDSVQGAEVSIEVKTP